MGAVPTDENGALVRKLPSSEVCVPGTSHSKQVSSSPGNPQSAPVPQYIASSRQHASDVAQFECKPPFPPELTQLLCKTSLCYLATQLPQEKNLLGYPHLSLMSFTYWKEEEVLIMTSRRNTQKLENLLRHPSVSVLVHDFPQNRETFVRPPGSTSPENPSSPEMLAADRLAQEPSGTEARTCSVTVYGVVRIVEDPAKEEHYKEIHLANNPKYHNFIVGDDIAVLLVDVEAARICNIHDRVSQWNRVDASATLQKSECLANIEAEQQKPSGSLTS